MKIYDEAIGIIDNIFMCVKSNGDYDDNCVDYNLQSVRKALERAKKVEEFISLCYVETTDTGHEVVFWRDENYEYAKQLLKVLKEELK